MAVALAVAGAGPVPEKCSATTEATPTRPITTGTHIHRATLTVHPPT